jgi:hypothetical protein
MDEKRIEQIRRNLVPKSTDELLKIWQTNDREAWTDEAFTAIRQILEERGETPGPQPQADSQDKPAQARVSARPGCVTAFAILMGIVAALSVLGSVISAVLEPFTDEGRVIEIFTALVLAVLYITVAVGLWRLQNWARIAVIVLQSLGTLILIALLFGGVGAFSLLGLVFGIYSIYWFAVHEAYFKPQTSTESPESLPPISDS